MTGIGSKVRARSACSAVALVAALAAAPAFAQNTSPQNTTPPAAQADQGTEIVVSGYRDSLESALRDKRNSNQIVDSISAQDIGQFPDENVAESLARITGVQIDRSQNAFGEGSFISIRGLGPDATRTFVNGRAVLSSKFADRSVDFRDLPADFVQMLQVIKSPTAGNIEGSLGGIVNVVTRRPLDNGGGFRASISAQAGYADLDRQWDPNIVGLISNSWADNTIGVTVAVSYSERDNRQDSFITNGYDCRSPAALGTGQACTAGSTVFLPRMQRFQVDYVPSERLGIGGTFQWRPSDRFELRIDGLWNRRKETTNQFSLIALTNAGSINPASVVTGADRSVVFFNQGTTTYRVIDLNTTNNATVFNGGVNAVYNADGFKIEGDFGYSRSNSEGIFDQSIIDNRSLGTSFTFDLQTPTGVPSTAGWGLAGAPTGTAGFFPFQVRNSLTRNTQTDKQYRLSATIDLGDDYANALEFGVRYSDAQYFAGVFGARARSNFLNLPAAQQVPFANPGQFISTLGQRIGVDDFGRQLPGFQFGNFSVPLTMALYQAYLPANFSYLPNVLDTSTINEDALSGYGQLNFETGRFSGNVGVRYVRTTVTASGEVIAATAPGADLFTGAGVTIRPISIRRQYSDWLPSANFRFNINQRVVLRLAGSRTIYRPEPDELATRGTLNTNTLQLVTGNPGLDPFRSWNVDASFEWYFGRDGLFSVAAFYKDIQSFISTNVPTGATYVSDGVTYTVVGPTNGRGGQLHGLEIGFQTSLRGIAPAPLDGFGIVANYTFIDDNTRNRTDASTGRAVGLPDVSRHSFNITGYYERDWFSARLAYNWRSSFLQADRSAGALNLYTDDYGSLDGRIAFKVLSNLELSIEGKNLTNAPVVGYAESRDRIAEYYNFGRRFFFGARATF